MTTMVAGLLGVLLYLTGASLQFAGMVRRERPNRTLIRVIALAAAAAHALLVWQLIFGGPQLDLGLFRMGALVTLTMVVIILASGFNRPLDNLYVVLFPVAALSLVCALGVDSHYHPAPTRGAGFVLHVILAVLAYSVLAVAVCQSLVVGWQEAQLRGRRQFALLRTLPPLQTMERLLFELLWIGLFLLTLTIGSGFLFLEDMLGQRVVHHTVLSICSWFVFSVLLWGRWRMGWRGPTAIRWTLAGFALLMLAYFGSKLMIEFVLID
ncbi:MAG: cytochrome c biogenesis protein CcsA [Gammaproteobacteria bacterium]|nr:cytochrome c biogenesis protein CcsA [Gammaproteobacteria bacterium]